MDNTTLNQIIDKWPNESDKDQLHRLKAIRDAANTELEKPRCSECGFYAFGKCEKFGSIIEEEFLYAVNPCPEFNENIPF